MTAHQQMNGEDKTFIPALKAMIDRVRTGWIVATVIVSVFGHFIVSLVMNGWIMSPAKTSDLDTLSLRIEATLQSVKAEGARNSEELKTLQNQHLALGNLIAIQSATLARLEEGQKGISARLDDWRAQPHMNNAGSPARPAPPPHARQRAQKKADEGIFSFTRQ